MLTAAPLWVLWLLFALCLVGAVLCLAMAIYLIVLLSKKK